MDIIAVDTDIHRFGAPWTGLRPTTLPTRPTTDPMGQTWDVSTWVNLGDNYEINNCLKKNLKACQAEYEDYKLMVDANVPGNHGLDKWGNPMYVTPIQSLNVAFEHGHLGTLWPYKKGFDYVHSNKPGCGFLKYAFAKALHAGRNYHGFKLKDKQRQGIINRLIENPEINALILGHSHPKEIIQELFAVNGRFVDVFILPQGRHYFKVFNDDIEYMGKD